MSAGKRRVLLAQRGAWDTPTESMPLAAGYLKATALADEDIKDALQLEIVNLGGGDGHLAMLKRLFAGGQPDILACSVLGWNFRAFAAVAQTFKQINPAGWVVFGGTHVAHQGDRVLPGHLAIDVIVNGEGEFIFRDLLRAYLSGRTARELAGVAGISYRDEHGDVITTAEPAPIADLAAIPSPFLSGAIPLLDHRGRFRYDVALMETNRGCPYHCAFCYWGGAVAQKVRPFPRERLRAELDLLASHGAHTLVLCDANFGMLRSDLEFTEDVIAVRERYGYPLALETSWAKNKSSTFFQIVRALKSHGLASSFTMALQTLNDSALGLMQRRNMKLNDWEDLACWLRAAELDAYAELIWGVPGETCESFLDGYDRLAVQVPRIAIYPLLVLPNTAYAQNREALGLVTVTGDFDAYEYVVATPDISMADNLRMQRFMLWARAIVENLVLRHIWRPLRELAGLRQSQVLLSMAGWFARCADPLAAGLNIADSAIGRPGTVLEFLRHLYGNPPLTGLLRQWWQGEIEPQVPQEVRAMLTDIFEYDLATRPIYDPSPPADVQAVTKGPEPYYVRLGVPFRHDVPAVVAALAAGKPYSLEPVATMVDLKFKAGFAQYMDNHELTARFVGHPMRTRAATSGAAGQIAPALATTRGPRPSRDRGGALAGEEI